METLIYLLILFLIGIIVAMLLLWSTMRKREAPHRATPHHLIR